MNGKSARRNPWNLPNIDQNSATTNPCNHTKTYGSPSQDAGPGVLHPTTLDFELLPFKSRRFPADDDWAAASSGSSWGRDSFVNAVVLTEGASALAKRTLKNIEHDDRGAIARLKAGGIPVRGRTIFAYSRNELDDDTPRRRTLPSSLQGTIPKRLEIVNHRWADTHSSQDARNGGVVVAHGRGSPNHDIELQPVKAHTLKQGQHSSTSADVRTSTALSLQPRSTCTHRVNVPWEWKSLNKICTVTNALILLSATIVGVIFGILLGKKSSDQNMQNLKLTIWRDCVDLAVSISLLLLLCEA